MSRVPRSKRSITTRVSPCVRQPRPSSDSSHLPPCSKESAPSSPNQALVPALAPLASEWRPILHASNQVVLYNPTLHALSIHKSPDKRAD
ncbi:hypothetical protein L210DRAFT_974623, partial [Boletus edulis BED1]